VCERERVYMRPVSHSTLTVQNSVYTGSELEETHRSRIGNTQNTKRDTEKLHQKGPTQGSPLIEVITSYKPVNHYLLIISQLNVYLISIVHTSVITVNGV